MIAWAEFISYFTRGLHIPENGPPRGLLDPYFLLGGYFEFYQIRYDLDGLFRAVKPLYLHSQPTASEILDVARPHFGAHRS
jgi:hypothetical protein